MRVGILRHTSSIIDGAFQYETVFLNALAEIAPRLPAELLCLIAPDANVAALAAAGGLTYRNLPVRPLHVPALQQQPPDVYLRSPPRNETIDPAAFYVDRNNAKAFKEAGIDLVLQLGPHAPLFAALTPFVMPIFDLNHRLQPEFPEVSAHGEFAKRENFYTNICGYATFVLVDSEAGKEDVLNFYGHVIDSDRIRVLPYYPPIDRKTVPDQGDLARVALKYKLPKRFFFYPAQFWKHKNHAAIVQAVRRIADETGERIPVVFCGAYADYHRAQNFIEVGTLVRQLGFGETIQYLGIVPDADMAALYTLCAALVMPTFFGPTNIPPLEAWHYGRPVITSDIRGMREQIGDAGLLVDPRSPADLAKAMLRLWRDEAFAAELAACGKKRLDRYDWNAFTAGVAAIVSEACERVRAGRTPRFPAVDLGQ